MSTGIWPLTQLAGWADHHILVGMNSAPPVFSSTGCATNSSPQPTCSGYNLLPWTSSLPLCWGHCGVSRKAAFPTHPLAGPRAPRQWDPPCYMIPDQCSPFLLLAIVCCRHGALAFIAGHCHCSVRQALSGTFSGCQLAGRGVGMSLLAL